MELYESGNNCELANCPSIISFDDSLSWLPNLPVFDETSEINFPPTDTISDNAKDSSKAFQIDYETTSKSDVNTNISSTKKYDTPEPPFKLENSKENQKISLAEKSLCDNEIQELIEETTKIISAADEPLVLSKDHCWGTNEALSGYHISTRKGTRSALMKQTSKDMELFLNELLRNIDRRVTPEIEDDDIGGKWMQSSYSSATYNIGCLAFHLTPNRSLDYLEDFKEIPGYSSVCSTNHNILAAILDATCSKKDTCSYKTIFYPDINSPGPIFLPEEIRLLLENNRHGLTLHDATNIVDVLCYYFSPVIDHLNVRMPDGTKITSSSIKYVSDMPPDEGYGIDSIKWADHLCICCLFMKQAKIGIQACSGNWITNGDGMTEDNPLEKITLLNYETDIDCDVKMNMNCFSNVININGHKMSSFIQFPFIHYKIKPIEGINTIKMRYEVVREG